MNLSQNMGFSIPKSNFRSGAGSALGIGGNYFRFNKSSSRPLSDSRALRSDWKAVGKDISTGMDCSR
jgi:hypothetical protein